MVNGNFDDLGTSFLEISDKALVTLCSQLLSFLSSKCDSLIFALIAAIVGNHFALIGQVKLLLVTNIIPGTLDEE